MVDDEFETNREFSDRRDQYSLIKLSVARESDKRLEEEKEEEVDKSGNIDINPSVDPDKTKN